MPAVFVRPPSGRLAEGELTHIERVPVDAVLARRQWDGYVAAWRQLGWQIIEIEPADTHPDAVFIEDALLLFGRTAVLTSPGAESRRGEIEGAARAATDAGFDLHRITLPATLDGGDVLKVGTTVYVGDSSRTNAAGRTALAAIVEPLGYTVFAVPVTRVLHLKSAVTALPDGTVIGYPPLVDDPGVFPTFLVVPEPEGTAVVVVDEHTVLMSSAAPASAALFRERGLTIVTADISEFEKLEGCVTCLSVRLRD